MEPLSVRLYEFIRRNPGVSSNRIISSVLDFRSEKASDVERILEVLDRIGRIYSCEIFDPELQRFVSFYYPFDSVPSYAGSSVDKEAFRCPFRASSNIVYHPSAILSFRT